MKKNLFKKISKNLFLIGCMIFSYLPFIHAQSVGINTQAPDASAALDVKNSLKKQGILIPSIALVNKTDNVTIINPAHTLLVYNTTVDPVNFPEGPGYYYWDQTIPKWIKLITDDAIGKSAWLLTGNTGTNEGVNFLGTIDKVSLNFRTNNTFAMRIDETQQVGIGTFPLAGERVNIAGRVSLAGTTDSYDLGGQRFAWTGGKSNTLIGINAGNANITNAENTAIGTFAGHNISDGQGNTFIGHFAGEQNDVGLRNTYIGAYAGLHAKGSYTIAIGAGSGAENTGDASVFIGTSAGNSNTIGANNVFVGESSGFANTTGGRNVFIGRLAGAQNITASNGVFIGTQAGEQNAGPDNTFIGNSSGNSNQTGNSNTYLGSRSGVTNSTGSNNTFLGFLTGFNNLVSNNTFVGTFAGFTNNAGTKNTFIGVSAGTNNVGGSSNTFVGNDAGSTNTSGANNTFIGNGAKALSNTATNATAVGSGAVANANDNLQLGNTSAKVSIGANVGGAQASLDVDGTVIIGNKGSVITSINKLENEDFVFPNIAINGGVTQSIVVPNVIPAGSAVYCSPTSSLVSGLVIAWARVSANNQVQVRFQNVSGVAIPAFNAKFNVTVVR